MSDDRLFLVRKSNNCNKTKSISEECTGGESPNIFHANNYRHSGTIK